MPAAELTTHSAEETQQLGKELGTHLDRGDLCLLLGTLGAGKTTLTQGIAWGAGAAGYAHSPTFVLVNEYSGRIPLYHVDLYRLEGGAAGSLEVHDLGIDEMLAQGACVVEWADKATEVLPGEHLEISIGFGETPDDRVFRLSPHSPRAEQLLARVLATRTAGGARAPSR